MQSGVRLSSFYGDGEIFVFFPIMENILYTISDSTAEITLNRPLKRNALDGGMIRDLTAAFTDADMRTDVRAVMLRANGTAFCAGADLAYLKEIAQNDIAANRTDSRHLMELFRAVYFSAKPSVAVVNGPALAGGCGLATFAILPSPRPKRCSDIRKCGSDLFPRS